MYFQPSISNLDLSVCGMTKGCYRSPEHCTDNCDYLLTWTRNRTDVVHFELQGTMRDGQLYMAMALSKDLFMVSITHICNISAAILLL